MVVSLVNPRDFKRLKKFSVKSTENVEGNPTFTIRFSLVDRLIGRKWIFGFFNWIDDISGNLKT